jgi:hypothetical protein
LLLLASFFFLFVHASGGGSVSLATARDMSNTLQNQIIRDARALITNPSHWCRGQQGKDALGRPRAPTSADAASHCAYGALLLCALAISGDVASAGQLADLAAMQITGMNNPTSARTEIFKINDMHGHGAVLLMFDEAVAAD